jgi:hypothetical protein
MHAVEFSQLDKIKIGRKEAAFIGGLFMSGTWLCANPLLTLSEEEKGP